MRALIGALILTPAITYAAGDNAGPHEWRCGTPDFLDELRIDRGDVRLNNFTLIESASQTIQDARAVNLSFSVVNKSARRYTMSYQLVAFDKEGQPTFAIGHGTGLFGVSASGVEQVGTGVHVPAGALGRTAKVCFRVVGGSL